MAVYSQITLTFPNDWVVGDKISIRIGTSSSNTLYTWTWNYSREKDYDVVEGDATGTPGQTAASNFVNAFNTDFPDGFNVNINLATNVIIKSETLGVDFLGVLIGENNTGLVSNDIDNYVSEGAEVGYVEKYFISYCDDFNVNRRVSILQLTSEEITNQISSSLSSDNWTKFQLELTGNRIVATNTTSPHWATYTLSKDASSKTYNFIFKVKPAEYKSVYIRFSNSPDFCIVYYNAETNSFNTKSENTFTINKEVAKDIGGGWKEVNLEITTSTETEIDIVLGLVNNDNEFSFAGDNLNGENLSGLEIKDIQLTEGSGAKELLADVNPISLTYESTEDFKFSPIRPSTVEVNMIFGSGDGIDFEEFWTADEKEWKILDIKDGTVEWSGYVIPDGFQYELKGGLYYATLRGSDGLATLDALNFVDDRLKPYGNQDLVYNNGFEFPFILIITEILKKLELDLDIWTCVDSYEQSMTKTGDTREADPLATAYANVKTYIKEGENEKIPYWYGSGEEWNCKEVLENVLYIFGAKLYQEFGVWRVKSINADIDYGSGDTQRYWRKYNTAATYLFDYEVVNDEINIPCDDSTKLMLNNDHVVSMDDVYRAFRMNYEYTFLRHGDNPLNLIPNGDFEIFDDLSSASAPQGWARVRNNSFDDYIRIRSVDVIDPKQAGGYTKAVEIGKQRTGTPIQGTTPYNNPDTGLIITPPVTIKNNDSLFFKIWNKYIYKTGINYTYTNTPTGYTTPIYRMVLIAENGDKWFLRNGKDDVDNGFVWEKSNDESVDIFEGTYCFYLLATRSPEYDSDDAYINKWYSHEFTLPNSPASGVIYFMAHGIATSFVARGTSARGSFPTYRLRDGAYQPTSYWQVFNKPFGDDKNPLECLRLTGVVLAIIPSGDDLPTQQDFIYKNPNRNYTLEVDPITVYNGDTQDSKHISNIIVPSNTGDGKNFWDDLGNTYGSSSLGLLTVRQIMRQYSKPYRILEGSVKIQDARLGSIYTFSILPNVRFTLHRGSLNRQKQYIEDATFIQLTDDELPSGGTEGGNTLDPVWEATGNSYCQIDNSLNTGYVVTEEHDVNPNSETYQDTREVVSDNQDLQQCPLGEPRPYYYASASTILNPYTLDYGRLAKLSEKDVLVIYDNEDGNYLYFVHLKSLGVVEQITTKTSPNNVLSDWVYLSDIIVDGYLYRVLRTDYVMSEFSNFPHYFKFS